MWNKKNWGQTAMINLHGCDNGLLQDRPKIKKFVHDLCKQIDMKAHGQPILKKFGKGRLRGYSLLQFIETSSITIHFDDKGNRAFIDIFSCKWFDHKEAMKYSKQYFKAKKANCKNVYRR